jgi:hypothetical protein
VLAQTESNEYKGVFEAHGTNCSHPRGWKCVTSRVGPSMKASALIIRSKRDYRQSLRASHNILIWSPLLWNENIQVTS